MARPKTIISQARQVTREDVLRWARNAFIFAGPAILVLLASIMDVIPREWQYGTILLYALNVATDAFRKWLNENRYQIS